MGDVLNQFLQVGHDSAGNNVGGKIVETTKGTSFTLDATHEGKRIVATAAITITVPTVGTLGNGYGVEIVNDGIKTFLNGALVSNIVLDTTAPATDTIDYVAENAAGTSTSTRTIIIGAQEPTVATFPATSSQADATTTAQ